MTPLHANSLIDLYNELTSPRAKDVIIGGWKKSGIWDAVKLGSRGLPSINPFKEIEPMDSDYIVRIDIDPVAKDNEYNFTMEKEICDTDTTDSEWEVADDRNAFDMMNRDSRFNRDVFRFCLNLFVYSQIQYVV